MQVPGSAFAENKNVRSILEFIARRELQPGQRLPSERELVKLLGTGRNSLREAMKVLEAMGILDIRHGSGIFLRKAGFQPGQDAAIWLVVHKNEICNALTVREALDLRAIDLIPPRDYPAVERRLQETLDALEGVAPVGEALLDHDLEFHNIIRRASGNELLLNICVALTGNLYDERRVLFGPEGPGGALPAGACPDRPGLRAGGCRPCQASLCRPLGQYPGQHRSRLSYPGRKPLIYGRDRFSPKSSYQFAVILQGGRHEGNYPAPEADDGRIPSGTPWSPCPRRTLPTSPAPPSLPS